MTVSGVERTAASAAVLDGAGCAAAASAKTGIAPAISQLSGNFGMLDAPCGRTPLLCRFEVARVRCSLALSGRHQVAVRAQQVALVADEHVLVALRAIV